MSRSSRALDSILDEGGEIAEAIKKQSKIHRTRLHAYRNGRGKPDADGIAVLHRLSGGRVAADGWEDETKPSARLHARGPAPKRRRDGRAA